jgi:MazG family protein
VTDAEGPLQALAELDQITRHLRRECPWDREQDERSIVPHTVEEAYELADAAHSGDDAKLLDELGDVLFQVYFLSLLLEERGQGDLATVAEHCRQKLIRRHPHVFGDRAAETAADVIRTWTEIKREDERGGDVFGDIPETLPATIHAQKVQKRAESAGRLAEREASTALADVQGAAEDLRALAAVADPEQRFQRVGELLYDAVAAARALGVDPELALRQHANDVRRNIEETQTQ